MLPATRVEDEAADAATVAVGPVRWSVAHGLGFDANHPSEDGWMDCVDKGFGRDSPTTRPSTPWLLTACATCTKKENGKTKLAISGCSKPDGDKKTSGGGIG